MLSSTFVGCLSTLPLGMPCSTISVTTCGSNPIACPSDIVDHYWYNVCGIISSFIDQFYMVTVILGPHHLHG